MSDDHRTPILTSPPGARVTVDGRAFDYFGGTGYLGLQGRAEVIAAACRAAKVLGVHSATSRSRFASQPVLNVEELAASFFGTEDAFYFVSGYLGNALLVPAIGDTVDAAFVDADSHYCVRESAALLDVPVHTFASRDPEDLREQLRVHLPAGGRPLVLTDGVFPSFGWIAPLDRYAEVLGGYPGAKVLVDDAHGFGTLGPHGRGTLDHFGLFEGANQDPREPADLAFYVTGTASKALGGHGGLLPGSRALLERVHAATHYFEGASAPAAPVAAATARALQIARSEPALRESLGRNVARVRAGLNSMGIANQELPTPIVGFTTGAADAMQRLHDDLRDAGILVPYAEAYSGIGPEGAMRLAVFATHTAEQIDRLLETLRRLCG